MAIDFPNSPAPNDNHTVGAKTWTFTDGKWALNVNSLGVVGPTGPTGPSGPGFTFRGAYNSGAQYYVNHVVTYLGSSWICIQTIDGVSPAENTWWTVFAERGVSGVSGTPSTVSGPQGISGVPGTIGVDGVTGPQGPSGVPGTWATSQTIVSGATYTPSSADVGKMMQLTNTSAINITVNTGLGLTAGQSMDFIRYGTGTVIFNGTATIRYTPGLSLRAQYSSATLFCVSTDTYVLIGDLSA
jgi:hypothetical protein